ncbi:MAG: RNA polymerase sigma factor [Thermomicrobiales bacterium]
MAEAAPTAEAFVDLADPARFRLFYAHALPRIYGYFLSRCGGDASLAEDLTQETFIAAVQQIRRGAVIGAAVPWLFGIARHKLLDHLRRQRHADWSIVSWEQEGDVVDAFLSLPESDLAAREVLLAALAAVPLMQREALILHYMDGLPVAEIAGLLSRSVGATESLLSRGRATFRQRVQHEQEAGNG